MLLSFFFFNDTATTEIYTLSLHDALPISFPQSERPELEGRRVPDEEEQGHGGEGRRSAPARPQGEGRDRKSTRLNSSHGYISYAVFCLKKKKKMPQLFSAV